MAVNRRDFLKIASASAAGLASFAFVPELTRGDVDEEGLDEYYQYQPRCTNRTTDVFTSCYSPGEYELW